MIDVIDSKYYLTSFGFACLKNIESLEFLEKNKEFFLEHGFDDVPYNLISRIGDLKNSKFFYGFHLVLPRWAKIIAEAEEFLDIIFLHPPIVVADSIKPRVDSLQIRLLVGNNSRITDCNEFVNNLELNRPRSSSKFEKRRCDIVQVNVIMSEKKACVIFPGLDGVTDMHGNFISDDSKFVKWCKDFFAYKWNKGDSISRLR